MGAEVLRDLNFPDSIATDTFGIVNLAALEHSRSTLHELPERDRYKLGTLYLRAALGYLFNYSGDEDLMRLAETCFKGLDREIEKVYPRDSHEAIDDLEWPDEVKVTLKTKYGPDDPVYLQGYGSSGLGIDIKGKMIIPVTFVEKAKKDPVGSLVKLTGQLSLMADTLTGRSVRDSGFIQDQRSAAMSAQMALHARRQNPYVEIGTLGERSIQRFPQGMTPGLRR